MSRPALVVLTLIQGVAIGHWTFGHHNSDHLWGMWFGFWLYNFFQNMFGSD